MSKKSPLTDPDCILLLLHKGIQWQTAFSHFDSQIQSSRSFHSIVAGKHFSNWILNRSQWQYLCACVKPVNTDTQSVIEINALISTHQIFRLTISILLFPLRLLFAHHRITAALGISKRKPKPTNMQRTLAAPIQTSFDHKGERARQRLSKRKIDNLLT